VSGERSEPDIPDEMALASSFSLIYFSMRRAKNQGLLCAIAVVTPKPSAPLLDLDF